MTEDQHISDSGPTGSHPSIYLLKQQVQDSIARHSMLAARIQTMHCEQELQIKGMQDQLDRHNSMHKLAALLFAMLFGIIVFLVFRTDILREQIESLIAHQEQPK